jgi:peptide/nickel transport system permease protein
VKEQKLKIHLFSLRKLPIGSGMILLFFFFTAAFAPILAPHDPIRQNLTRALLPPAWEKGGTEEHPLGTDNMGRDVLSRLIYGSRVSITVGVFSVLLGLVFGASMGLIAGFFGGRVETVIMRLADMQLAVPFIMLAITIIGALGPSLLNVIVVLAVGTWPNYARMVRGEVLSVKQNDYVELARIVGCRTGRILLVHILPNVVNSLIVLATLNFGMMIIFEGGLSFLGVGVQPPTPSWGNMLADGRAYITVAWHLATFPGIAIMLVVLGTNLFGDWLRDILDPKRKQAMSS